MIYPYRCPHCKRTRDVLKKLAEIERKELCQCGNKMERQIAAPRIAADYPGYECPVSGKWIEGRRAHEENLKRTGCRLLEPGEKDANERRRLSDDAQLEANVGETVERFIAELPTDKRERLGNELAAGADAQVVRQTASV